jgi:hypothetical protein
MPRLLALRPAALHVGIELTKPSANASNHSAGSMVEEQAISLTGMQADADQRIKPECSAHIE